MVPKQRLRAEVFAGQPCARRTMWVAVTPRCPHCTNVHTFRIPTVTQLFGNEVERSCPVSGQRLALEVTP